GRSRPGIGTSTRARSPQPASSRRTSCRSSPASAPSPRRPTTPSWTCPSRPSDQLHAQAKGASHRSGKPPSSSSGSVAARTPIAVDDEAEDDREHAEADGEPAEGGKVQPGDHHVAAVGEDDDEADEEEEDPDSDVHLNVPFLRLLRAGCPSP